MLLPIVVIRGRLVTRRRDFLVSKIISSLALSPTAILSLSRGALVHPQPGTILSIKSESVPVDLSQNTWESFEFWGAKPKSNFEFGIVKLGSA